MKAAIDIGTNTVLMLVAEFHNGKIKPIHEEHRVPRLGKGVDTDKNINEDATDRVIDALSAYRKILDADFPEVEEIIVTATSAVRDASNRNHFIKKVKQETGFEIRLLSGKEEAEYTTAGALSMLDFHQKSKTLVLDIGGGSTEVALVNGDEILDSHSFDMGSVKFTERFLKNNPPSEEEILACREEIQSMYKHRPFEVEGLLRAVGVAGTVTTLAGMALNLTSYQPEQLNGFSISRAKLQQVIHEFSEKPHKKMLAKHPVYLKGREDIFLAGMLILEGFLIQFDLEFILVSTGGIRHGAMLKA